MAFCGQCGTERSGGEFCTECGAAAGSTSQETHETKTKKEKTPISVKADILSVLWVRYKSDPDFADFVEFNDLGLPLAYAVSHGIIDMNKEVAMFVDESFDALLTAFHIDEDTGFDDLETIMGFESED